MTLPASQPARPAAVTGPKAGASVEVQQHPNPHKWKATLRLASGERLSLHRPDDPLGEASAQLTACVSGKPQVIAIVGGGLGFLTEAAHNRFPEARLVVLEPIAALAHSARTRTPRLYESDRVRVITGPQFDGGDLWRLFDASEPEGPGPALLVNPALQHAVPAAMASAVLLVRRAVSAARMNARARRDNAGRYVLNTLRNLPHVINGGDLQCLAGQFSSVPAVLVAAGPSLDRNLEALKLFRHRALIVATDTTWRPLVSAGIDPHFVVSLDPSPLNARHLVDVKARRDTWVLAEASVDPDALRAFEDRVGTFRVDMHHPWPWLADLGVQRPLAHVWGSVLTAVFDLTLSFGCDPLIFVGADLAYTDHRPYCRGTAFERDWAQHAARGVSLRQVWHNTVTARAAVIEPDVLGQRAHTAAHLVEFRNWLVAHASRQAGRRVINATGAGILHGTGIEQADLATVLGSYPERGDAIRDTVRDLFGRRVLSEHQPAILEALTTIAQTSAEGTGESMTSPVKEWLAFGRPSLTTQDIHSAAIAGRLELERAWSGRAARVRGTASAEAPDLRLYEADRVARMRALLTKEHDVIDGCAGVTSAPGPSARPKQALDSDASRILDWLLAMPRLTNEPSDATKPGGIDVPLSYRFPWTSAARPWVAAFEERLLDEPEAVERQASDSDGAFWIGPIEPVIDDPARTPDAALADVEDLACLELTAIGLSLFDAGWCDAGDPQQRVARAVLRATGNPAFHQLSEAPYRLEFVRNGTPTRLPVRIDALMRALTGTIAQPEAATADPIQRERVWTDLRSIIVPTGTDSEPRTAFLSRDINYIEPDVLTARGLPPGYSLAGVADDRVVFVPRGSMESWLIAPDGGIEPGSAWPVAITGEIPWGLEGGALAWSSFDCRILLRPRAGAEPSVDSVPFTPMRVALAPDGSAFWSSASGGVWEWLPGQAGRLLIETPTCAGIFFDGTDLVLSPLVRNEQGRATRQRLRYQWRCALNSPSLRSVPGDPEGQCTGLAVRGGWTARAYAFSDLIRLESGDGNVFALACHSPTAIAWAGGTLVAIAAEGHVLAFHDLVGRLDSLCKAGGSRAV